MNKLPVGQVGAIMDGHIVEEGLEVLRSGRYFGNQLTHAIDDLRNSGPCQDILDGRSCHSWSGHDWGRMGVLTNALNRAELTGRYE